MQDFICLLRLSGVSLPASMGQSAVLGAELGADPGAAEGGFSNGASTSEVLAEDGEQQYFQVRNYGGAPWALGGAEHLMQSAMETIIREVGDSPERPVRILLGPLLYFR